MTISNSGGVSSSLSQDSVRAPILRKDNGKLEAPKNIIQTVSGAKALFYQYRTEHLKRIELYALIEGLLAGNPPYDPGELARNKLSFLSNFNNLDARSLYERGALAYWNLLNETATLIRFEIEGQQQELHQFAEIMARHWSDVVRSWPSFNVVFNTLAGQLVKFGISPALWPDEKDWRWRTVEISRFYVEDQAQSDIEMLTCICVESVFTAQFLMEVYNKFEGQIAECTKKDGSWDYEKCPWNLNELSKYLLFKANTPDKQNQAFYDMMDIQMKIQNGDLSWNQIFTDDVRLVSMLYQEYDGKISHYMYDKVVDYGEFLFFQDRQYQCMHDGIIIFTASPGEFTIHSNRGLGHKIFSGSQALMQLDCSAVDMAKMAATTFFNGNSTGSKDFEAIRIWPGVPTNIGTAEMVENRIGVNIQPVIGVSQYLMQKMAFNTANSGDDPSTPDRDKGSISALQARLQSYREFAVSKNNIAHFYSSLDIMFQNMTAKMMRSRPGYPGYEYVRVWRERCEGDGVPRQFLYLSEDKGSYFELPVGLKCYASRAAGSGSAIGKIVGLETIAPYVQSFGPKGVAQFQRDMVGAALGPESIPAYLSDIQDPDETSGGASLAATENAVMSLGSSSVIASPNNEQTAHFVTHLALGNDTIRQRSQQQMSAVEADKVFNSLIQHMQDHYQFMIQDPFKQQFLEQIKEPWNELLDYAKLNNKNARSEVQAQIKKQQQDQAQTQAVMSDEERKNLKAQGDERRANISMVSKLDNVSKANATRGELARTKIQEDAANDRLKISLEAQGKTAQAATDDLAQKPLPELRQSLEDMSGGIANPNDVL